MGKKIRIAQIAYDSELALAKFFMAMFDERSIPDCFKLALRRDKSLLKLLGIPKVIDFRTYLITFVYIKVRTNVRIQRMKQRFHSCT